MTGAQVKGSCAFLSVSTRCATPAFQQVALQGAICSRTAGRPTLLCLRGGGGTEAGVLIPSPHKLPIPSFSFQTRGLIPVGATCSWGPALCWGLLTVLSRADRSWLWSWRPWEETDVCLRKVPDPETLPSSHTQHSLHIRPPHVSDSSPLWGLHSYYCVPHLSGLLPNPP